MFREAILQKQDEQIKIITESLKATLDAFSIKINTKITKLENNRRTEEVLELSETPSGKRAKKRNRSDWPESPSGSRPSSENLSGKRQKTNQNLADDVLVTF